MHAVGLQRYEKDFNAELSCKFNEIFQSRFLTVNRGTLRKIRKLVWKFCGKAQFTHTFGRFAEAKLRYFLQWQMFLNKDDVKIANDWISSELKIKRTERRTVSPTELQLVAFPMKNLLLSFLRSTYPQILSNIPIHKHKTSKSPKFVLRYLVLKRNKNFSWNSQKYTEKHITRKCRIEKLCTFSCFK